MRKDEASRISRRVRRTAFLGMLAGIVATPVSAQSISMSTALAATGVQDASCTANARFALGEVASELRGEFPHIAFAASGIAASTAVGQRLMAGHAEAEIRSPTWNGWRADALVARHADYAQCFTALPRSREEVRVSRGGARQGFWVGYGMARGAWFDTLGVSPGTDTLRSRVPIGSSRTLSGGVWRNAGPLLISLTLGSRSQNALSVSSVQVGTSPADSVY